MYSKHHSVLHGFNIHEQLKIEQPEMVNVSYALSKVYLHGLKQCILSVP